MNLAKKSEWITQAATVSEHAPVKLKFNVAIVTVYVAVGIPAVQLLAVFHAVLVVPIHAV
jgi:hypothetical protein